MIAIIFIILLIIGFLIYNPIAVNQDTMAGQRNSTVLGFSIYCIVCVGIFYYLMTNGSNFAFWKYLTGAPEQQEEQVSFQNNQNKKPETERETEKSPQAISKNEIDFERIKSFAASFGPIVSPIQFAVVELSDYDGMSKAEIFAQRKRIVDGFGTGLCENYQPNENVLGRIQDGKPWWGTEGILCKGQGRHASDGMSRESSYFNNPLILLNLGLGRVMNGNRGKENCAGLWPVPESEGIYVYPDEKTIRVDYNLSGFMKEFEGSAFYDSVNQTDWFEFGSINARDFGYTYAQVYQSQGIRFANWPNVTTGADLVNYWCLGHSCQIEGGCNNICPSNDKFTFFVTNYPAHVFFKLYKEGTSHSGEPDAYFQVYLN